MYEYDYVTIYTGGGFWMNNSSCEHREIINRKAADGWRFVGYVPAEFTATAEQNRWIWFLSARSLNKSKAGRQSVRPFP